MKVIDIPVIKDWLTFGGGFLVVLFTVLQIVPIKLNPWDAILGWLGDRFNSNLLKRIKSVEKKLDQHIEESKKKELADTRLDILNFANECMRGVKHTREQFDFVITQCDEYELYIEKNNIRNGVIASAIKEIRRIYDHCIQQNDFLKENNE